MNLLHGFVGLLLVIVLFVFLAITRLYKALPQNRPSNRNSRSLLHVIGPKSKSPTRATANDDDDKQVSSSRQGELRSRSGQGNEPKVTMQCTTTIFLGSGGHTAEMLQLVSGLDTTKYSPRHYVVGWDDETSVEKVHRLEASRQQKDISAFHPGGALSKQQAEEPLLNGYTVHRIPRSRHVHQSMITTPFTLVKSLWVAMPLIKQLSCLARREVDGAESEPIRRKSILLMNGPGTCFALALAVIGSRILGVPDELTPDLVFVESFARVKTLSLAGKLLYPLCDSFLVQWPSLVETYPRAKYIGVLV